MREEYKKVVEMLKEAKDHLRKVVAHLEEMSPTTPVVNAVDATKPVDEKLDQATKSLEKMTGDDVEEKAPVVSAEVVGTVA